MPNAAPENTCTFNGECGPGHVCLNGTCYSTCAETLDCGSHTRCSTDGICVADTTPVIQCSGPGSCDDGNSCFDGKCLAQCAADATCGEAEVCKFGLCQQVVTCFDQDDCGGTSCVNGSCQ